MFLVLAVDVDEGDVQDHAEAGREEAAYQRGAHSVYATTLLSLEGTAGPPGVPPADPGLRGSWDRGADDAAEHCHQLAEQITGQQLQI